MQQKLQQGRLLNEKGQLAQAGYHTQMVAEYNRKHIKRHKWRIKEWDYYIVSNEKIAVALTIADNSYMAFISASFLDFENAEYHTASQMKFFTFGKLNLPSSSDEGNLLFCDKRVAMSFSKQEQTRKLACNFKNFFNEKPLECQIVLTNPPRDQMVIATPFFKKHAFYFNTKINCMTAEGYVIFDGQKYEFDKVDSLGTLDWGRGIWTYKNTWYWGSMQTYLDDGRKFGFNIGYGFGDTSRATENMIFLDGIAHKLDQVSFNIPKDSKGNDDFLSPWTFTSNDGKFEMDFVPILDRFDNSNIGIIASNQHQVFGKFTGRVVLEDNSTLTITDKLGFAEKVTNKW